jgi:hypothetical protein
VVPFDRGVFYDSRGKAMYLSNSNNSKYTRSHHIALFESQILFCVLHSTLFMLGFIPGLSDIRHLFLQSKAALEDQERALGKS